MRLLRRGGAASTIDLLVVGLGNPGREYERTRHNVGWLVVDELARRLAGSWRSKFSGRLAEVRLGERKVALLKPETFMNDSGRSVGAAARFFKVEPEALLVVHDDVDLEPGRLQARAGGGLAGHNGLRSLAQALGSQDFLRLRIGVGRPGRGDRRSVAGYVLSPFDADEDAAQVISRAADARRRRFAGAVPTRARVSEPALPFVLAAVHEHLHRGLVCALPEDADARDAAEAAGWFLGNDRVALLPSRGVHWGSALEPPPHLVGERARALDVLAHGGLVCASATALAEALPPPDARPQSITGA